VFERFTDRARRVVVLAQEEARMLNHNYIGTEHILLGLAHEEEGVGGRALASLDISLETVRQEVRETIGEGEEAPTGHIPFTPRAKKVLELSLREALQLGHNYIGTEHILLGLVREGEGVAAQVLEKLGADLNRVRQTVVQQLSGYGVGSVVGGSMEMHPASEEILRAVPLCPTCSRPLERTLRYRTMTVDPVAEEAKGEPLTVRVAYCFACGRAIGTSPG
jgi:ATP-dependent Clp protease ATP-binding subunit ClpC